MDSTPCNPLRALTRLSLAQWFLFAILMCPTMAALAGLIHPLRIWASAGEWCQVLSPNGQFQALYGYQCDRGPVGLVRRFD